MMINGALTAALCAWSLLSFDPRIRPLQIGTIAYLLTFLKKLHRINPSPEGRDNPEKKTADNVRLWRESSSLPSSLPICILSFVLAEEQSQWSQWSCALQCSAGGGRPTGGATRLGVCGWTHPPAQHSPWRELGVEKESRERRENGFQH